MTFCRKLLFAFLAVSATLPAGGTEADPVAETLSGFEEAIRLAEQLSEEKSVHARQMRVLQSEVQALQAELNQTRAQIQNIESQRTEALAKREELVRQRARELELLQLVNSLVEEIRPTLSRIHGKLPPWIDTELPTEDASFGDNLLYLRNLQSLNQTISSERIEIEEIDPSSTVQVDLVSFGFGGAFFSSPDGSFGGRYVFDGMEWTPELIHEFAPLIRRMVRQEEGLEEPGFLTLPVAIGGGR